MKIPLTIRSLPDFHTLYGTSMPVFGKNHSNQKGRTLSGMKGLYTKFGHFIQRAWGNAGSALCGATIRFEADPVVVDQKLSMARCCAARYWRIKRAIKHRENPAENSSR